MSEHLSRDDVAHLANLARIDLSDAEIERFGTEIPAILDHVRTISAIVDDTIEPMSHPGSVVNAFRPDEVRASLTPEEALSGAPAAEEQRFSVPRILGEE